MHRNDLLLNSNKVFVKVIIIIVLLRLALAVGYDKLNEELVAPDGNIFSASGIIKAKLDIMKTGSRNRETLMWYFYMTEDGSPHAATCKRFVEPPNSEMTLWTSIIGWIYSALGYKPLAVRFLNIGMSICSAFLLYGIIRCRWALIVCLLLPTQIVYSMSLCRDFVREIIICAALWVCYLGSREPKI